MRIREKLKRGLGKGGKLVERITQRQGLDRGGN